MKHRRVVVSAAACLLAAPFAFAQSADERPAVPQRVEPAKEAGASLNVGDKAPALAIGKWVKGEPITGYEKGRVYVVEFWATWCGPCIAAMPHLTELQKHYGEAVTIIGVTSEDANNSLEKVEAMVKEKGDAGMGYAVAWDDGTKTKEALFRAAGQRGIPCSFVIDQQGSIAYIGHPMWLDKPLAQITRGTWDAAKGMAEVEESSKMLGEIGKMSREDPARALAMMRELEKDNPGVADVMSALKFRLLLGENSAASRAEAHALVNKALERDDAAKLGAMARMLIPPGSKPPSEDIELALAAAKKAVDLTHEKNVSQLEALAKVYAAKEDFAQAAAWQKKAVAVTPESRKPAMERILAEYEEAARQ